MVLFNEPGVSSVLPRINIGSRWSGIRIPTISPRTAQLSPREFHLLARNSGVIHSSPSSETGGPTWKRTSHPLARRGQHFRCLARALTRSSSVCGSPRAPPIHSGISAFSTSARGHDVQSGPLEALTRVKRLMRRVPYPVAIVTASDVTAVPEGGPSSWRGATVSSFNTVTLDPSPIVCFNIKRLSSTLDAIQASGRFRVHLLNENKKASELAQRFATGNTSTPFGIDTSQIVKATQQFDFSPSSPGISEPPFLPVALSEPSSESVSFSLLCTFLTDKSVVVGDHVVVFGVVDHAGDGPSDSPSSLDQDSRSCLIYVNGDYGHAAHSKASPEDIRSLPSDKDAPGSKQLETKLHQVSFVSQHSASAKRSSDDEEQHIRGPQQLSICLSRWSSGSILSLITRSLRTVPLMHQFMSPKRTFRPHLPVREFSENSSSSMKPQWINLGANISGERLAIFSLEMRASQLNGIISLLNLELEELEGNFAVKLQGSKIQQTESAPSALDQDRPASSISAATFRKQYTHDIRRLPQGLDFRTNSAPRIRRQESLTIQKHAVLVPARRKMPLLKIRRLRPTQSSTMPLIQKHCYKESPYQEYVAGTNLVVPEPAAKFSDRLENSSKLTTFNFEPRVPAVKKILTEATSEVRMRGAVERKIQAEEEELAIREVTMNERQKQIFLDMERLRLAAEGETSQKRLADIRRERLELDEVAILIEKENEALWQPTSPIRASAPVADAVQWWTETNDTPWKPMSRSPDSDPDPAMKNAVPWTDNEKEALQHTMKAVQSARPAVSAAPSTTTTESFTGTKVDGLKRMESLERKVENRLCPEMASISNTPADEMIATIEAAEKAGEKYQGLTGMEL